MNRVLVWKVYREQRWVWLAMAVLAVAAVVLRLTLLERDLQREAVSRLFCLFAYVYGLVAGAVLLAGEREAGTATFLESLPVKRLTVWWAKCGGGLTLVLAQVVFLWLLLLDEILLDWTWGLMLLLALVGASTVGFAWGLFFSGRTKTSLGAIFAAVLGQTATAPLTIAIYDAIFDLTRTAPASPVEPHFLIVCCLPLVVGLILGSGEGEAWRDLRPAREPALGPTAPAGLRQLGVLLWLEMRQAGGLFLCLADVGMVAGMLLPLWVLGWPVLTLLLGVIVGVSVFAGERLQATGRFLAEQRLPLGRIWAVNVGARMALALGVVQLMLIPIATRDSLLEEQNTWLFSSPERGPLLARYVQRGPYLIVGLVHGFSVGCLCGLLFRKPVIAGAIAVTASLLLLLLWIPSLLVGGLHAWQYWGLPVLLLLTVGLLVWPWATGRLGSRRAVFRLASGLVLAILWFAGALAYRVLEVPLVEDQLDLAGFERSLEDARKTETGVRLGTVLNQAPQRWHEDWARELAEVVRRPLGKIEDVQAMANEYLVVELLVLHGIQQQDRGDPVAFLDHLATGLALMRQVRHLQPSPACFPPIEIQESGGVERWLERLDGRPDLLRRALDLLREHREAIVKEADNAVRADYLAAVNVVKRPESLACNVVRDQYGDGPLLAALLAPAWRTPWEQARLQRLVRQLANEEAVALPLPPPLSREKLFPGDQFRNGYATFKDTTVVQIHELMVALQLFQVEAGRPARTLEELTPNILPAVPPDRATGKPISYQLTSGGNFKPWGVPLPPGWGILTTEDGHTFVLLPPRK